MADSHWSEWPPTEPGWYWVLVRLGDGVEECCQLGRDGLWVLDDTYFLPSEMAEEVKFGPRIPSAEELAAIAKTVRVRDSAAFAELDAALREAFGIYDDEVYP